MDPRDIAKYYLQLVWEKILAVDLTYLVFVAFILVAAEIIFLKSISHASFLIYGLLVGTYVRKQREDKKKTRAILRTTAAIAAGVLSVLVSLFLMTLMVGDKTSLTSWAAKILLDSAFLVVGGIMSTKIELPPPGKNQEKNELLETLKHNRPALMKLAVASFILKQTAHYAGASTLEGAFNTTLILAITLYLATHAL